MLILKKKKRLHLPPDAPLMLEGHGRPVTRRQFIQQGMMAGGVTVASSGLLGTLLSNPAFAGVMPDLQELQSAINCSLVPSGAGGSVPFICFDLAGGANFAGSNVLVGQRGTSGTGEQMDTLSTAGYSRLGLPGDMLPGQDSTNVTTLNTSVDNAGNPLNDFTNHELNLAFHADSALLYGIREQAPNAIATQRIDGCVIPARSDNDTGNNPHNPLYALVRTGARGEVVDLIGSRNSVSGGNSMAPAMYINPEFRPTKVDRPSDVTGMVDVGDLTDVLSASDVAMVMESITRATRKKMTLPQINTELGNDALIKELIQCNYLKAADITDRFASIPVDPLEDPNIQSIFEFTNPNDLNDNEFRKTASVMKMVMNGYAAGGCITMGGYDYHTGDRITGETRDLRAGRCIGACLEYAFTLGKPLMIYVFSDGSLASNGSPDDSLRTGFDAANPSGVVNKAGVSLGGGGKGEWSGDNSSTASSFFLAYDPANPVPIWNNDPDAAARRQIGYMNDNGAVVTSSSPAANNVNLLVNMVMLNYMALNGQITPSNLTAFTSAFPNHGLGNNLEDYIAFGRILPP